MHHDSLFKRIFAEPEHAAGELRAVLPGEVAACLDWSSLTLCPGSFVDDELRSRHTDLLFTVATAGEDGDGDGERGEALVYVLFEHQSQSDPLMAYRLLVYVTRIWERWLDDHRGATRLPPVIPVVLYHGGAAWSAAADLRDLIAGPPELVEGLGTVVPRFGYLVDDLSRQSDQELRTRAMTALARVALFCFKHAWSARDLETRLAAWSALFREVLTLADGAEALASVLRYIAMVAEEMPLEVLTQAMGKHVGAKAKEMAVTLAQQLIEQGRAEGREKWRAEGRAEGLRDACIAVLRRKAGLGIEEAQRLVQASWEVSRLETLHDALVEAPDRDTALALLEMREI